MSVKTRLFKSNKTQAVRLPKAVAFPEDVQEVEIVVEGDTRIVRPVQPEADWSEFFNGKYRLSEDYPTERDQGPTDKRRRFFED